MVLLDSKELQILSSLRANARESLTKMSRRTGIPVSTIYERLKQFEESRIRKHTCLIDFPSIGYDLRIAVLLSCKSDKKDSVRSFVSTHHHVNNVLRVNNGFDFLVEAVFENMAQVQTFLDKLDTVGVRIRKELYVLDEIVREGFLSSKEHLDLIGA